MCKSALDAVNENKLSFAYCRFFCERNNGNDVLLVEGKTDYIFYSRFTKKYNIFCRIPNIDNDTGNDCTVKGLVSDMFSAGKNIYGIIDPDYNNGSDIKENIRNRIHVIDANSLETLIVKYSDENHNVVKAIANFNKLFRKGKYKNEQGIKVPVYIHAYKYSPITDEVLKWAFFIGSIRKLNALKQLGLDFQNRKQESCNYKKYIRPVETNKEKKTIDFDKEQYLNDLWNNSKYSNNPLFLPRIKELIPEYNEKTVWDICQGHDIFDFIECLNSKSNASESNTRREASKNKYTIPKWEIPLLNAFDIDNFKVSPLQNWFNEINSKVTDCKINR